MSSHIYSETRLTGLLDNKIWIYLLKQFSWHTNAYELTIRLALPIRKTWARTVVWESWNSKQVEIHNLLSCKVSSVIPSWKYITFSCLQFFYTDMILVSSRKILEILKPRKEYQKPSTNKKGLETAPSKVCQWQMKLHPCANGEWSTKIMKLNNG
jgi:hypothetical protein